MHPSRFGQCPKSISWCCRSATVSVFVGVSASLEPSFLVAVAKQQKSAKTTNDSHNGPNVNHAIIGRGCTPTITITTSSTSCHLLYHKAKKKQGDPTSCHPWGTLDFNFLKRQSLSDGDKDEWKAEMLETTSLCIIEQWTLIKSYQLLSCDAGGSRH